MSSSLPAGTPPSQPAEPKPNPFARITGVLFSPNETFASIARRPDWVVPLLLILVVGYATTFFFLPRLDWDAVSAVQAEQMKAKNPQMSQEDIDRVSRMSQAIGKVIGWIAPILAAIWYAIVAGVLLLAFRLFGGEGTFKQAFSATLYGWVPLVIYGIVATVVAVARGGKIDPTQIATLVKSNPAFLLDMKAHPALFSLLSAFDVFTIWTVVLLIIGFAALSRVSKARAATIIVSLWLVIVLIKSGFAAMGAAGMKKA
jgi:hypothetical protein